VQVEIAKKVFQEKVGETNGHGAMPIGKEPIIAQRFIFTTAMGHLVKKN
jgi:hypothetical protein